MQDTTSARLRDLETVLLWEGAIDNARVRELLGVQSVWASRLLAQLTESSKRFAYRETSHAPLMLRRGKDVRKQSVTADEYLKVLAGSGELGQTLEDARQDLTRVEPEIFAAVARSVRAGCGLKVFYRSMSHPLGSWRVIYPHAIVRAPRRWHVRAWCAANEGFRDFNLGRVADASPLEDVAPKGRAADRDWNAIVTLEVVAHPSLTGQQQQMIAQEYYPHAAARKLSVRRCLIGYVVQDLRIATDPHTQQPPEFQLCALNPSRVLPLFAVD